ncbi:MAG: hypothetical protein QNK37_30585 [Acidobacteriota bacterium]|nr:hypothetical protein [Acidobacteriota bacterium]
MKRLLLICVALLATLYFLSGGDTEKQQRQMELKRLAYQEEQLLEMDAFLDSDPRIGSDLHLFLSSEVINGVLAAAVDTKIPIPHLNGAFIQLIELVLVTENGVPRFRFKAEAGKGSLSLALDVLAWLEITLPSPEEGRIQVHIEEIVPKAGWRNYQIGLKGFVNKLMNLDAVQRAALSPQFTLPLQMEIPIETKPEERELTFSAGDGTIEGRLTIPSFSVDQVLSVRKTLFLDEGIHLFLTWETKQGGA